MIDLDAMSELTETYMLTLVQTFGNPGVVALRSVIKRVREIFEYVDPVSCAGPIVVFKMIDDTIGQPEIEGGIPVVDFATICHNLGSSFAVQVLDSGRLIVWREPISILNELSHVALVYEYLENADSFIIKEERRLVPKVVKGCASSFAIPTFSTLEEALEAYREKSVRRSHCPLFKHVWFDDNRVFFKPKPEIHMRKSLTNFLDISLRGVEVRPEQVVDETHPIDIKVTWMFQAKHALIEIKWLGTPKYDDSHLGASYTDYRARQGAKQLADYLDSNQEYAPLHTQRGYLVVIDGRRQGLNPDISAVNRKMGFHYEHQELDFDPKYHEIRNDFAYPIRMFAEPKCQAG